MSAAISLLVTRGGPTAHAGLVISAEAPGVQKSTVAGVTTETLMRAPSASRPPATRITATPTMEAILESHRRMSELEALLTPGTKPTPFSGYVNDLSPTEAKVVQDHFARIRMAMLAHLRESEIPLDVRTTSLRWAIGVGISFIGINVAELGPNKLRGYGALGKKASSQTTKFQQDLERLVDQAATYVRQGIGRDLSRRLSRLGWG
jgi:hypothetical protein